MCKNHASCNGNHDPLEAMKAFAAKQGGECLSLVYLGARAKHEFVCEQGHHFQHVPSIAMREKKRGWCPECVKIARLNKYHSLAKSFGGECLDKEYRGGSRVRYRFRCSHGHEWETPAGSLDRKNPSWCPECASFKTERSVRDVFSKMFGAEFQKARPDWLKNPRGNRMELDGFNEALKLGFEYHGYQHYTEVRSWGHGAEELKRRQSDDIHRMMVCKTRGIRLVEIPYTVALEDIPAFIFTSIQSQPDLVRIVEGLAKQNGHGWTDAGVSKNNGPQAWVRPHFVDPENMMDRLHAAAEKHGGVCLSTEFRGASGNYRFRCTHGHEWEADFQTIAGKHKRWCPVCAGIRAVPESQMEKLHAMAASHGGACMETKYKGSQVKYRFRCAHGHEWEALFHNIMKGFWCRQCSEEKGTYAIKKKHTSHSIVSE